MLLRKKTMNEIKGDPRRQKAVALAVYLKSKLDRNSTIRNYNPNKVQVLTKVSSNTFRRYLPLMVEMGLVRFDGKDGEHLVVCCLHSTVRKRNIDIRHFCFKSFFEVYRSLRAFLALLIQHRKNYVWRTLQIARNPKRGENFKAARKTVKRLVRQGVLKSLYEEPKEYGISLKRIAKEVGNCIRTTEGIVNYAVKKKWWQKQTHFVATPMLGVNRRYVKGFMFTTRNYAFVVYANTYSLSASVSRCLGMVNNR